MISSNAGTWSNIDSAWNNVVKAFKFSTGDIVNVKYIDFKMINKWGLKFFGLFCKRNLLFFKVKYSIIY